MNWIKLENHKVPALKNKFVISSYRVVQMKAISIIFHLFNWSNFVKQESKYYRYTRGKKIFKCTNPANNSAWSKEEVVQPDKKIMSIQIKSDRKRKSQGDN